jgi:hypothetical protein
MNHCTTTWPCYPPSAVILPEGVPNDHLMMIQPEEWPAANLILPMNLWHLPTANGLGSYPASLRPDQLSPCPDLPVPLPNLPGIDGPCPSPASLRSDSVQ